MQSDRGCGGGGGGGLSSCNGISGDVSDKEKVNVVIPVTRRISFV